MRIENLHIVFYRLKATKELRNAGGHVLLKRGTELGPLDVQGASILLKHLF